MLFLVIGFPNLWGSRKITNKKPDKLDFIIEEQPNLNPLVYLCNKRKQSVKDYKFMMTEDIGLPSVATVKTATKPSDTTITLKEGHGKRITALSNFPSVWLVERTDEILLVENLEDDKIIVVRGYGKKPATDIPASAVLRRLSSAFDGSTKVIRSPKTGFERLNYCQLFRENTRRKFKIVLESAFLFGQPFENISNYDMYPTTGGLKYWIDTSPNSNVMDVNGGLSYIALMEWFGKLARGSLAKVSGQLVLFCGNNAYSGLLDILNKKLAIVPEQNIFGFNTQTFTTSYAKISVHQHHLLTDEFENYIFAVNPNFVEMRVMNVKSKNVKVYTGIFSFYLTHPELHGYMKNVRNAV